jgi:hypothetical protein
LPEIRAKTETLSQALPHSGEVQLRTWQGASGRRYLHIAYSLLACPAVPNANYVLARRMPDGHLKALKVGRVQHDAPTLNLAQIRHEGALLGANEVHLHVLAKSDAERILVEFDLGSHVRVRDDEARQATRH